MQIQTLDSSITLVYKHFKKFPSASASAMFGRLRKQGRISFFGDYPLMAMILNTMHGLSLQVDRNRVLRALNKSEELRDLSKKEKTVLLDQLLNNEIAETKHALITDRKSQVGKTS